MNLLLKATQFLRHNLNYQHSKTVTLPYNKWNHASKYTINEVNVYSEGIARLYIQVVFIQASIC